jgi:hypothetical protein
MNKKHNGIIACIVVIAALLFIMIFCLNRTPRPNSLESFLKDRYAAGSFLEKSFTVMPEGASLTETSKKHAFDADFPGEAHVRSVVKRQRWIGHSHYQFRLNLSEAMLSSHNQASSKTMVAEDLLNHFFAGLSKLGFRNLGSPFTSSYPIPNASNVWYRENSNNISINGSVWVAIKERMAVVVVDISEVYE